MLTKDERKYLEDLQFGLNQVEAMMENPAWKMFLETQLKPLFDKSLTLALKPETDPYAALRYMGAAGVARDLSTWAEREIQGRRDQIALLQSKDQEQ